jgi:hypothetical protein
MNELYRERHVIKKYFFIFLSSSGKKKEERDMAWMP